MKSIFALAAALTAVAAAPVELEPRATGFESQQNSIASSWDAGATREWRIHSSCNATQANALRSGLDEAVKLAAHARDHVRRYHNESEIYRKYFGNGALYSDVIGSYDIIASGDRAGVLFRCDDPDKNCANNPTWAGHWRGNNATGETVICSNSFYLRRYLASMCNQGYNVRQGSRTLFWASDLIHRLYHIPAFGQGHIEHYSEGYDAIVAAAANNSVNSGHDSDGLQYFALDVYAWDVAAPGVGCPGPSGVLSSAVATAAASAAATSATATSKTSTTAPAAAMTPAAAASTSSAGVVRVTNAPAATSAAAGADCHTHADGTLHCV